ncbi:hypothetical protein [Demequina litorisediminis]|uniref:hypothetical protein n=1 Tax=Demequina litorisediminis TaxID=1849022 RepID=UPI0032AFF650
MKRWLLGPDGWTMTVAEPALEVGDTFRQEWAPNEGTPGEPFGFTGEPAGVRLPVPRGHDRVDGRRARGAQRQRTHAHPPRGRHPADPRDHVRERGDARHDHRHRHGGRHGSLLRAP